MSLADYLAKNYLTADAKPEKKSKKRKRKDRHESKDGAVVVDDDVLGWGSRQEQEEEDDGPVTTSGQSAEFRKSKKSAWKTVGAPAPSSSDQAVADAILQSAATEHEERERAEREENDPDGEGGDEPAMESGARAGLQSAEQVTAAVARRAAQERARFKSEDAGKAGKGQETIYRDASGRIINVAMKRAEARRNAEEEAAAKEAAEKETLRAPVQESQRLERAKQLQDAKYMTLSRYADDEALNDEMKQKDRWNDPAAQFLTATKASKSITGKPLYQGPFNPNRYGIRPGHRWDGVDRSNGFEKEYFAAQNRRRNVKELEYAWQMDE